MTIHIGDPGRDLPDWVPEGARNYLQHTEGGRGIRDLARAGRVQPSTVLRQVRRVEGRRDDPLIEQALTDLSGHMRSRRAEAGDMNQIEESRVPDEARLAREGGRILRRLSEPGTILAVARDMEMAVVVRETASGGTERLASVERGIAQALALKDWIASDDTASRVTRYRLTAAGRQELRRQLAVSGLAEAPAAFVGAEPVDDRIRHMRSILGDSPLSALARRRDKDGRPFLPRELVAAGERLREDFELAQMGGRVAQDWDALLTGRVDGTAPAGGQPDRGAAAARDRVSAALTDLGPGLADVALRCCCYLEGLETLERRMGWAARSGKVVLRIALQRLQRHYQQAGGRFGPMIG